MTHRTHKTRYSDSSLYDEVCTLCNATDADAGDPLRRPCPKGAAPDLQQLVLDILAEEHAGESEDPYRAADIRDAIEIIKNLNWPTQGSSPSPPLADGH